MILKLAEGKGPEQKKVFQRKALGPLPNGQIFGPMLNSQHCVSGCTSPQAKSE